MTLSEFRREVGEFSREATSYQLIRAIGEAASHPNNVTGRQCIGYVGLRVYTATDSYVSIRAVAELLGVHHTTLGEGINTLTRLVESEELESDTPARIKKKELAREYIVGLIHRFEFSMVE